MNTELTTKIETLYEDLRAKVAKLIKKEVKANGNFLSTDFTIWEDINEDNNYVEITFYEITINDDGELVFIADFSDDDGVFHTEEYTIKDLNVLELYNIAKSISLV